MNSDTLPAAKPSTPPVAKNERQAIADDSMGETPRPGPAGPEGQGLPHTEAQIRSTISQSHEVTYVHGSEIAAAPFGTDDEAGRTGPASPEVRARAEAAIQRAGVAGSGAEDGASS